jgi:hypothetical protein
MGSRQLLRRDANVQAPRIDDLQVIVVQGFKAVGFPDQDHGGIQQMAVMIQLQSSQDRLGIPAPARSGRMLLGTISANTEGGGAVL